MIRLRVLIIIGILSVISLRFSSFALAQSQETRSQGCALSVGGQGYYISGGAGDIATRLKDRIFGFDEAATLIQSITKPTAWTEPTAIIIADDFQKFADSKNGVDPVATLQTDISGLAPTDADAMIATERVPHGYMVQEHFKNLLGSFGFADGGETSQSTTDRHDNSFDFYSDTWTFSGQFPLMVVSLDTLDYDTQTISDRIDALMTWLGKQTPAFARVVVNMSFSVLPCSIVREFYESDAQDKDFKSYINDAGHSTDLANLLQWLQEEVNDQDPLRLLITNHYRVEFGHVLDKTATADLVFVASAGNIGIQYPFPLYPGAWPEVVDVGATSVTPNTLPSFPDQQVPNILEPYSNPAEVLTYGAYQLPGSPTVQYEGTSFAAPVVSLYSALMLSETTPECPFAYPLPLMAVLPSYTTLPEVVKEDCNTSLQGTSLSLAQVVEKGTAAFSFASSDGSSAVGSGSLMPNAEIVWSAAPTLPGKPTMWAFDRSQAEVYDYDLGASYKSVYFPGLKVATGTSGIDGNMIIVYDVTGTTPYPGSTVSIR